MKKRNIEFLIVVIGIVICIIIPIIILKLNKKETIKENDIIENYYNDTLEIKNSYKANIVLDDKEKSYTMNLIVEVTNDSKDNWNKIYFRDYPSEFINEKNGNVSLITEVMDYERKEELEIGRQGDKTVFYIKLNKDIKPNEKISISFKYKAYIPNLNARYGYQTINNDGMDFYLANSIPILCPYENGKFQYYPYFSIGECFYSKIADYEVNITIPRKYTIIATGDRVKCIDNDNETITYKYIANKVRDFAIMIGDSYEEFSGKVDGIKINTYFHKGNEDKGIEALYKTIEVIHNLNDRLGKYPYNVFNVVELQMEMKGMEYPRNGTYYK